jgi:hypothetical protein
MSWFEVIKIQALAPKITIKTPKGDTCCEEVKEMWHESITKEFGDSDAEIKAKDDMLIWLGHIFKDCEYARKLMKLSVKEHPINNVIEDLLEYWEVCEKAEEQKAK